MLEYWPKGLFERTGNIWRAQGRRARLEFKHFRRYAMTDVIMRQEEIEGWRGEIRDSEVVKTHEEALEDEQQSDGGVDEEQDAAPDVTAEDEDGELREGDDSRPTTSTTTRSMSRPTATRSTTSRRRGR